MMTVQMLETRCAEIFNQVNLPFEGINVSINGRLKRTMGRCKYIHGVPISLEFSKSMLDIATPDYIDNVIKHECCHAIAAIETGESQGHNAYFKNVCARVGCSFDSTHSELSATVEETHFYKYIVYCNECGQAVGKYHRAGNVVKTPERYRCKCGGSLKVVQNF